MPAAAPSPPPKPAAAAPAATPSWRNTLKDLYHREEQLRRPALHWLEHTDHALFDNRPRLRYVAGASLGLFVASILKP